jgi:hypothetical protein
MEQKMEQKKSEHARSVQARDGIQVKRVKQLLYALDSSQRLSGRLEKQLMGSDGLRPIAAAMTILLTDYGGTTPPATCELIAEEAPNLYRACGFQQVLAVCEEIQPSELHSQSALFQRMFERFNIRYFAGRLPFYKVRVVYDVWDWQTNRCGYPKLFPPGCEATGFMDFAGRQILIRFLGFHTLGLAMAEHLIHEMALAATGGQGDKWQAEMERLKGLGAPAWPDDLRGPRVLYRWGRPDDFNFAPLERSTKQ